MPDNLETVSNHANLMDAEMTRSILESYGVEASIAPKSKTKNPLLGMAGPLKDSYDVKVPAQDMERARELLESKAGEPEATEE